MSVKISLTQFIQFKAAISTGGRMSVVKNNNYSYAIEYWLNLRNSIQKFAEGKMSLDVLGNSTEKRISEKKIQLPKGCQKIY